MLSAELARVELCSSSQLSTEHFSSWIWADKKQPLAERIVLSAELARVELCSSLPWDATYWDAAANDVQTLADLASPIMGMCGCVDANWNKQLNCCSVSSIISANVQTLDDLASHIIGMCGFWRTLKASQILCGKSRILELANIKFRNHP